MTTRSMKKGLRAMTIKAGANMVDNGGRRLGYERRQFDYSHYYPERRVGRDRRIRPERRSDLKLSS